MEKSSSIRRYSITVSGMVQGVGYRYFARDNARLNSICGWVANSANGDVELEIQGDESSIENFLKILKAGPQSSKAPRPVCIAQGPSRPLLSRRVG